MNELKANPIFRREAVTCEGDCSVRDAARLMRDFHVGDVIVVERGEKGSVPVGIVTDRDITVSVVAEALSPEALAVRDVMSDEPYTVDEAASPMEVAMTMRATGVRRLPVVDEDGCLVGIISADDLLELIGLEVASLAKISRHQRHIEADRRAVR